MKASCVHRLQIRHLIMSSSNNCCLAGEATTPQHPLDKPRYQVIWTGGSGTSGWGEKQELPSSFPCTPSAVPEGAAPKDLMQTGISRCLRLCAPTAPFLSPQAAFVATQGQRGKSPSGEKRETPCSLLRGSPGSHVSCLPLPLAVILPGRTSAGLLTSSPVLVIADTLALWVLSPSGQQRWEQGKVGAGRRRGPAGIRGSIQLRQIIRNDSLHFLAKAS